MIDEQLLRALVSPAFSEASHSEAAMALLKYSKLLLTEPCSVGSPRSDHNRRALQKACCVTCDLLLLQPSHAAPSSRSPARTRSVLPYRSRMKAFIDGVSRLPFQGHR